jgi:LmbE family N-acetylglucosaminyl deacetylase
MNVLVIAAHADDETLGCGGTLLAHKKAGDSIYWYIATRPVGPQWPAKMVARLTKEISQVAKAYGVKQWWRGDLGSTTLDSQPLNDLIDPIRKAVEEARPQVVYSVHFGDVHSDHRRLFEATSSVLKTFYMKKYGVQRWLSFECLSSTEASPPLQHSAFLPNVFRDISPFMESKIKMMDMYRTQLQAKNMPRNAEPIRALGRYRGASIGVEYAEAFMLIRELL